MSGRVVHRIVIRAPCWCYTLPGLTARSLSPMAYQQVYTPRRDIDSRGPREAWKIPGPLEAIVW